jgi:hypothetical protein
MGWTNHFWTCKYCDKHILYTSKQKHPSFTHSCKSQELSKLISFQLYLNEKGLINNYDWEYEKEAQKFLKIIDYGS